MDFVDVALLRLANATTRRAVFDDLALEHILGATYASETLGVEGPFDPTFDDLRFGGFTPTSVLVHGGWSALGGADRTESRFEVSTPYFGAAPRTDAVWKDTVIGRARLATSFIESVARAWPAVHSIDEDISPLPTDPAALEQARRDVLRARLRAGAVQPDPAVDPGTQPNRRT
jgi:hypothetical protein